MRWRLLDRVDTFSPWTAITGRKAVSLEEYSLLKPFGRQGIFPASLIMESCVELVRWLVAASSGFEHTCILKNVENFHFLEEVGMGGVLTVSAEVSRRGGEELIINCNVNIGPRQIAKGELLVGMMFLRECFDRELLENEWQEIHGTA